MGIIQNTLEQGLIYAIMALGVYLTYRVLDFPDLTVDGSFTTGATGSPTMGRAMFCTPAAAGAEFSEPEVTEPEPG